MSEPVDLSFYFSIEELHRMGQLECRRHENLIKNYYQMLKLGLSAKPPSFMNREKIRPAAELPAVKRKDNRARKVTEKTLLECSPRRSKRARAEVKRYEAECKINEEKDAFESLADIRDSSDSDFDPRDINWSDDNSDYELETKKSSKGPKKQFQTRVKMIVTKKKILPRRKCVNIVSNYKEEDFIDDDNFIYCHDCKKEFLECCPEHPLLPMDDTQVDIGLEDRAVKTLPPGISLSESKIKGAGLGVWTDIPIQKNTLFGPYQGTVKPCSDVVSDQVSGYGWLVKQKENLFYIDGEDVTRSNWLRYVNCSRTKREQNVDAFQYKGQIYYQALRDIRKGNELLVWYGDDYANELGIDKETYSKTVFKDLECVKKPDFYYCSQCGVQFVNLYSMKRHERSHSNTEEINYRTEDANANQPPVNQDDLPDIEDDNHIRKTGAEKWYECEHCDKRFTDLSTLQSHIRTHTGEKPYNCEHCDKRFTVFYNLQSHIRTHTGEKPYKCEHCDKRFTRLANLQRHIRTHTGEKPYKCEHCDKRFTQSNTLQSHIRTHTGEKPYKCEHCEKRFTRSNTLQSHIRTHTGEKPYKCKHCDKRFTQPNQIKSHKCTFNSSLTKIGELLAENENGKEFSSREQ